LVTLSTNSDTTTETNEITTSTVESLETTTLFQKQQQEQETTVEPELEIVTTLAPIISTKLRNHRTKHHRKNESLVVAESQNVATRRRQKTTAQNRGEVRVPANGNVAIIDRHQLPKRKEGGQTTYIYPQTTTRPPRRKSSTSRTTTSTQWPPVILLPKASDFSQKPPNPPKLIRFWSNMPLVEDATPPRPSPSFSHYPHFHYSNNGYQRRRSHMGSRINSRQPSEKFFREVTFQELQNVLRL
jgi:hypothetical protein